VASQPPPEGGVGQLLALIMPEPVGVDDTSLGSIYAYVLTLYDRYNLAADIERDLVE
jgi:hypothetical protein